MLVDDDVSVREVLRDYIQLYCPQFIITAEAGDGEEAVLLAERHKPDVILMDVRMPVLDGIEATRRIKQELGLASSVITFTSYAYPELESEAKKVGALHHLRKPFTLDELQNVLTSVVKV
ncbi:MAG TPA: response regulator [Firmicutes bacterium]|nr:response regulator [Bacillota bacterium]